MAYRGALLRRLAGEQQATVVIDLGGLADTLPRLRVILEVAEALGYDAIAPSDWDDRLARSAPDGWDATAIGIAPAPQNGQGEALILPVADLKLGVLQTQSVADDGQPDRLAQSIMSLADEVDILVVVSRLGSDAVRRLAQRVSDGPVPVVLLDTETSEWSAEPEVKGASTIMCVRHGGSSIGLMTRPLAGRGSATHTTFDVNASIEADPTIVRIGQALLPDIAGASIEALASPAYAAGSCEECHPAHVAAWRETGHARALDTLRREGRVSPACLPCHSEFARMTGSYANYSSLDDSVQCVTCHGDASIHASMGDPQFILSTVPEDVCVDCHTQEKSPGFDYEEWRSRVHSESEQAEACPAPSAFGPTSPLLHP